MVRKAFDKSDEDRMFQTPSYRGTVSHLLETLADIENMIVVSDPFLSGNGLSF